VDLQQAGEDMRKYILMMLTAVGLMLAAPQYGAAAPIGPGGLNLAADQLDSTEQVRHRRWHRRWYRYRVVRCWHRRHWSGRRCW
jgi:hypothetical protein